MFVKAVADREWTSAGYEGAERAILRLSPDNGRTALVRVKAGSRGKRHRHLGVEHVLVLSGKVSVGGHTLAAGDYLFTDAYEEHDLIGIEDSLIFVSSERPVELTE